MPDPTIPLQTPSINAFEMNGALSKFNNGQLAPNPTPLPYTVSSPTESVDSTGAGGRSMTDLDKLNNIVANQKEGDGTLQPGDASMSVGDLKQQPFKLYDPAQQGGDENMLAQNQSGFDRAGNAVAQLGVKAVAYLAQSVGFIGGAPMALATQDITNMTDNFLVKAGDVLKTGIEDTNPIYKTDKYTKGNIWDKLATSSWWLSDGIDRAALGISMLVPGLAETKGVGLFGAAIDEAGALNATGIVSKGIKAVLQSPTDYGLLGKVFNKALYKAAALGIVDTGTNPAILSVLKGLNKAELYGYGIVGQSGLNAKEAIESVRTSLKAERTEGGNQFTDSDIEDRAKEAALKAFGYTVPLSLVNELIELPMLFSSARYAKSSVIGKLFDAEGKLIPKALESQAPPLWKLGLKAIGTGFEHGQNESMQVAVGRTIEEEYGHKHSDINGVGDETSSILSNFANNIHDPNGQNNIALGTIQGIAMTLLGAGKDMYTGRYAKELAQRQTLTDTINKARMSKRILDGDFTTRDEAGKMVIGADGNVQFDQYKLADAGLSLVDTQAKLNALHEAIKQGDAFTVNSIQHDNLASLAYHYLGDSNGIEHLENVLKIHAKEAEANQKSSPVTGETITVGDIQTPTQQLNSQLQKIQEFKKIYNAIEQRHAGITNLGDVDEAYAGLKRNFLDNVKKAQFNNGSDQFFINSELQKNSLELSKLGISNKVENPSSPEEDRANQLLDANETLQEYRQGIRSKYKDLIDKSLLKDEFKKEIARHEAAAPLVEETIKKDAETAAAPVEKTVKVKTKTGDKELEVGTEYMLGKVTEKDDKGNDVYRFPTLTILGKNEDGTIKIKSSNGSVRDIKESDLEDYKLAPLANVKTNKTANYFVNHANSIFQYNFGKNNIEGKRPGRLEYEEGKLFFVYNSKIDGKVRRKEVDNTDFTAQKDFKDARIKKIGTLKAETATEKQSREEFTSKQEIEKTKAAVAEKLDARKAAIKEIHDDIKAQVEKVETKILDKKNELTKIQDKLNFLRSNIDSKKQTPYKQSFSKAVTATMQSINALAKLEANIQSQISELESVKSELEFNITYVKDFIDNIGEMPESIRQITKDLKDQISHAEDLYLDMASEATTLSKMLDSTRNAIKELTKFLKGIMSQFDSKFSGVKDLFDNIIASDSPVAGIPEVKEYVSELALMENTKKDITINEDQIKSITDEIDNLYKNIEQLGKETEAKRLIYQKFDSMIKAYDKDQAEKERLKNDKGLLDRFYKTVKSLDGEISSSDPEGPADTEIERDINDSMKDLSIIISTGTDQKYENSLPDSPARRNQAFLLNIDTKKDLAGKQFKIVFVTEHTEEALGLKGIIDRNEDGTVTYPNTVRLVYVDEENNFLDREGNPTTDLSQMAYTTMHDEALQYDGKDNFTNKSKLDPKEVRGALAKFKKSVMLITPDQVMDNAVTFTISRGIANKSEQNNNVLDTGLVEESDLFTQVVFVSTKGKQEFGDEGKVINIPLGKTVFNYKSKLFFLNSRNFTKKEAKNVTDVLIHAVNQMIKSGEISPDVRKYLSGVLYFKKPSLANEVVSRNQVYFQDNKIFIGDKGESFDMFNLNKDELLKVIENAYIYVNNQSLLDFKKNPTSTKFNEIKIVNGEVEVEKIWDTYQHYLLSKREDNSPAPLSTNIIKPVDKNDLPIIQKYPIITKVDALEQKSIVPTETVAPTETKAPKVTVKKGGVSDAANAGLAAMMAKPFTVSKEDNSVVGDKSALGAKKTNINTLNASLAAMSKPKVAEVQQVEEQKEVEKPEELDMSGFGEIEFDKDAPTRTIEKVISLQGDINKEEAEVKEMLPQVSVQHVKNLISITGGGKAWGVALPHFLYISEQAPYGVRYHEAFEQVFNYMLDNKGKKALWEEFKNRDGSFTTFDNITKKYSEASLKEAKEEIADEFANYQATGELPKAPEKAGFFKSLLNFLKHLFSGKANSIEEVFSKLSKGEFANHTIVAPQTTEANYSRTVVNTPESLVQDTLIGMTTKLFQDKWSDDTKLLMQLEDNEKESTQKLFDQLHTGMQNYFEGKSDKSAFAYFSGKAKKDLANKAVYQAQYVKVYNNWKTIDAQWGNYMTDLKTFLKTFEVAFTADEEGNVEFNQGAIDEMNKSSSEYNSESSLFMSSRNKASKIVKLLFATVTNSEFIHTETKNQIGGIVKKYLGNEANLEANQMYMPNLAPYAKLFNYTLHNSSNTNGIVNIIDKLRGVSANKEIAINANLQILLNRLGYDYDSPKIEKDSDSKVKQGYTKTGIANLNWNQLKLLMKVEGVLSKQKPKYFMMNSPKIGETRIIPSLINDKIEQTRDQWIEAIKASKFGTILKNKIMFKKEVLSDDSLTMLHNLNINISKKQIESLKGSDKKDFHSAVNTINKNVEVYTKKFLPVEVTAANIGFAGALKTLASIYVKNFDGDGTESQHWNTEGKPTSNSILNNYVSYIINDINSVKTLDEFKKLNPQYNDLYMGSGHLLNNILFKDGQRTGVEIITAISEGTRKGAEGLGTSGLTFGERVMYEVNNNLNGIYYSIIPADATTEWGLKLSNIIAPSAWFTGSKANELEEYSQIMYKALLNEIELAKDFKTNPDRSNISALNQQIKGEGGLKTGESIRFFKGMLSKTLNKEIEKVIENGTEFTNYQTFKAELNEFLEGQALKTMKSLKTEQYINQSVSGTYQIAGLDTTFRDSFLNKKKYFNESEIRDLLKYREMNYVFQNIEMHKIFFNDPAQYKDAEKRIKSFLSGRGFTHQSEEANTIITKELNKSGTYSLSSSDFGFKTFSNSFTIATAQTVKSYTENVQEFHEAMGNAAFKMKDNDIADAQSYMDGATYMSTMFKSEGRSTSKREVAHQWLMAYQRNAMLDKNQFRDAEKEYPKELREADKKVLSKELDKTVTFPIVKPIISGVRMTGNVALQYLYKLSTSPMYYYFVEGTPAEQVLLHMQNNNIGMVAMDTAHKVGRLQDGDKTLINKTTGEVSTDFTDSPATIDYKYFGIQVETDNGEHTKNTQGSQATKVLIQDLISFGTPSSFEGSKAEWDAKPESEKNKYPEYTLVNRHNKVLSNLAAARGKNINKKLGIKEGEFGYTFEDKKKVSDFILEELTRRELPDNLGQGITLEKGEFKSPLEANVNYTKIKELLWSIIENNITKPKVSGGPKILLSALLYEKYVPKTINGKEVLTSSKLKFYSIGKNGTNACEIAVPFRFGLDTLGKIEKSQGIKFATQKEGMDHVMEYLNKAENKSILEGIGFRIPTQGLNSIDFFTIKEFIPPQMGDVVIFPSEITTKAGSDFDVDKMNTYLKNYFIDKNGYPKEIPYLGDDEKAKDRLADAVGDNYLREMSLAASKERIKSDFDNEADPEIDFAKSEQEEDDMRDKLFIQSLENEYFSTMKDIMALPQNFARLTTPNDAKQLKDIGGYVKELKEGSNEGQTKYALTNPTRLIDSSYMSKKRHLFLIMKQAIGIAAVANTYLTLNQLSDFSLNYSDIAKSKNFKVRFPFNKTEDGLLHVSGNKNQKGDWISNLHSQIIDGSVDVAKDEWLADLLGNADALSPFLFMFKLGIEPETAALFINQPIIQEYLRLKGVHKNTSKMAKWVKDVGPQVIETNLNKSLGFDTSAKVKNMLSTKPDTFNKEDLIKGVKGESDKLTQAQLLSDYRGYESLAGDLFIAVQGTNWDTSSPKSPEAVANKRLAYQAAVKTQSIAEQTKNLLSSSFLGEVKNQIEKASDALSTLFNTRKGISSKVLNDMTLDLSTQFFDGDSRIKYLQKAEASMIDYLAQTQIEIAGQPLGSYVSTMFLSKVNIANQVEALQKSEVFKNNLILDNLNTIPDVREGYPSVVKLKEQDYDTYTSNTWTAAFRELRDSAAIIDVNGSKVSAKSIFMNILASQMLQYGSTRGKGSFLHLIPNEDYAKLISPAITNISQDIKQWYDNGMFYRANWGDNVLVPEAKQQIIEDTRDSDYPISEVPYMDNMGINNTLEEAGFPKVVIITQPADQYKNKPYIKITDIVKEANNDTPDATNKVVTLYRRVDADNNKPLSIGGYGDKEVMYYPINKTSNKDVKEYQDSVLYGNEKFAEPSMQLVANAIANNIATSVIELTELVSENEFKDMFSKATTFEDFKNNTDKKDC